MNKTGLLPGLANFSNEIAKITSCGYSIHVQCVFHICSDKWFYHLSMEKCEKSATLIMHKNGTYRKCFIMFTMWVVSIVCSRQAWHAHLNNGVRVTQSLNLFVGEKQTWSSTETIVGKLAIKTLSGHEKICIASNCNF